MITILPLLATLPFLKSLELFLESKLFLLACIILGNLVLVLTFLFKYFSETGQIKIQTIECKPEKQTANEEQKTTQGTTPYAPNYKDDDLSLFEIKKSDDPAREDTLIICHYDDEEKDYIPVAEITSKHPLTTEARLYLDDLINRNAEKLPANTFHVTEKSVVDAITEVTNGMITIRVYTLIDKDLKAKPFLSNEQLLDILQKPSGDLKFELDNIVIR